MLAHGARAAVRCAGRPPMPAYELGLMGAEVLKTAIRMRARTDCAFLGKFH